MSKQSTNEASDSFGPSEVESKQDREARKLEKEIWKKEKEISKKEKEDKNSKFSSERLIRNIIRLRVGAGEGEEILQNLGAKELTWSHGSFNAQEIAIDGLHFFIPMLGKEPGVDVYSDRLAVKGYPAALIADLLPFSAGGGIMLDIGGNVGITSVPRAALGLFSAVHAFEPDPLNFACLSAAITANRLGGTMKAWPCAVGAKSEKAKVIVSEGIARHRISTERNPVKAEMKTRDCEIISLGDWFSANRLDLDSVRYVKVDTQGFEVNVLDGSVPLLAARRAVWQLEISPGLMQASGREFGELITIATTYFRHFMDIRRPDLGIRPIVQLAEALDYVVRREVNYTDLIALP
jgi:FkbM family methyltransferase